MLQAIRSAVLAREGALLNITAEDKCMNSNDGVMQEFLASMPSSSSVIQPWSPSLTIANEGLVVPTQVYNCYCRCC